MSKKSTKQKARQYANSKKKPEKNLPVTTDEYKGIKNSLGTLIEGLGYGTPYGSSQINQVETLFKNNRWYMVSNMRQILSELYVEHGIIQTLVDQPVDDAFRKGIIINTDQLSEDEIDELETYLDTNNTLDIIAQAAKWGRLYGGGGVLTITGQDPATPLKPLKKGDILEFRAVDMWELFFSKQNVQGGYTDIVPLGKGSETDFNYYGHVVNATRVLLIKGKDAPSFIRPRLRGWGMSELERMVRSFNSYLKNSEVVFELLDEAKVDVYKINGFNSAMASNEGTALIQSRTQLVNQLKSFQNAVTMDKDDEYDQKQISFSGLGEMLTQIRQNIASDLKMPITKLFGVSSAGFSSGEDDIENYNSMVEGEIRSKSKNIIISVLKAVSETLFGMSPDDFTVEFPPLRVLSAEQEENVKNAKYNRFSGMYAQGILTDKEYSQLLKKHELLDIDTEVMDGTREAQVPETPSSFDSPADMVASTKGQTPT